MKTLVNNLAFRHAYQGFFLLLMIAIPNITLGMTTLYNNQTGLTFTSLESWGIIAVNLIIFYISYLWAKSERLIHSFSLNRKDIKAIIWGFVIIFLMGLIGSNLMLLTHTSYHAELQKTLTTIPILPVAIGMMTTAFLQELLFRNVDFHLVVALFNSSCFSEFWSLLSLPHAYQSCPSPPLYRNGFGPLYGLSKKRELIYKYHTSCFVEPLHLRCYNSGYDYSYVTENAFSVFCCSQNFKHKKI